MFVYHCGHRNALYILDIVKDRWISPRVHLMVWKFVCACNMDMQHHNDVFQNLNCSADCVD